VPAAMTVPINPWLRAMEGTDPPRRCIALHGEPGIQVRCSIYPLRPTPCHDFAAWQADGSPDPNCTRARARSGLPALPHIHANASDAERRVG